MLERERQTFLALPQAPYDASDKQVCRVSSLSLVRYKNVSVHPSSVKGPERLQQPNYDTECANSNFRTRGQPLISISLLMAELLS